MKVLVFVKATPNSEKGVVNGEKLEKLLSDMGAFNDKLVAAGIMKEADGLKPSSAGKRIRFSDEGHTAVLDGPFAETKELVAGYWVWNVKSMAEAVEWAKLCPNPMPGEEGELEIRPTYSAEEFDEFISDGLRDRIARPKKAKRPAPARKKTSAAKTKRRPARAGSKK